MNVALWNTEHFRYAKLIASFSGEHLAHGVYRFTGKLAPILGALIISISLIVASGSEIQMIGVNAGGVVFSWAAMQCPQSVWDRTPAQNPYGTMSGNEALAIPHPNVAVAEFASGSIPQPTGIGKFNLGPESSWKVVRKPLRSEVLSGYSIHVVNSIRLVGVYAPRGFLILKPQPRKVN